MRDNGLNRGLVQQFETTDKRKKGVFWGFRKMFWDYLNKLGVGFYDSCCPDANGVGAGVTGTRFNNDTGSIEFLDPYTDTWTPVDSWAATTTTTTSTTTTTTA